MVHLHFYKSFYSLCWSIQTSKNVLLIFSEAIVLLPVSIENIISLPFFVIEPQMIEAIEDGRLMNSLKTFSIVAF